MDHRRHHPRGWRLKALKLGNNPKNQPKAILNAKIGMSAVGRSVGRLDVIARAMFVGTFHNVSKRYLHLYVAEFQFPYNNRFNDDIFGAAIEGC